MTKAIVARKARWHLRRLQRILSAKTQIRVVDLQVLARVLDKPVAKLLPPPAPPDRTA